MRLLNARHLWVLHDIKVLSDVTVSHEVILCYHVTRRQVLSREVAVSHDIVGSRDRRTLNSARRLAEAPSTPLWLHPMHGYESIRAWGDWTNKKGAHLILLAACLHERLFDGVLEELVVLVNAELSKLVGTCASGGGGREEREADKMSKPLSVQTVATTTAKRPTQTSFVGQFTTVRGNLVQKLPF